MHTGAVLSAARGPAPQLWDFNEVVCYFMKTTTAECNPGMELFAQQTFCCSRNVVATDDMTPTAATPAASDGDQSIPLKMHFSRKMMAR